MHIVWVLIVMITNPDYVAWQNRGIGELGAYPPDPEKELVTGIYATQEQCLTVLRVTGQGRCAPRQVPDQLP